MLFRTAICDILGDGAVVMRIWDPNCTGKKGLGELRLMRYVVTAKFCVEREDEMCLISGALVSAHEFASPPLGHAGSPDCERQATQFHRYLQEPPRQSAYRLRPDHRALNT